MKKGGILFLSLLLSFSCKQKKELGQGEQLAKQYCASCHQFPEPELLNKSSWELYMLPRMGVFLGVIEHDSLKGILAANAQEQAAIDAAGIVPSRQIVTDEEWQQIKDYYLSLAPKELEQPKIKAISNNLDLFKVKVPEYKLSPPSATMIRFDTVNNAIFVGDANSQSLSIFSSDLNFVQGAKVGETPVWMQEFSNEYMITMMGSFSPTDVGSGYILSLPKGQSKPYKVIDSLRRPVHSSYGDIDGDGLMDIVTCEFSKWTGVLSWWHNNGDGNFDKRVLRYRPGAVKAYLKDMNKDGYDDIIALFGQGDEGVFTYYNDGKGNFKEEYTLRFPPSYGSTYFQLFDFNKDGFDDIIYTAGDNADFPPILKPYHGIYIYINDGHNKFEQQQFLQLNGAYAAMPADYDNDGDIDIAAISFFPDYQKQSNESFVFYNNDGQGNYTLSTIENPTLGRWIVMDNGDVDNDGDIDIVLGALAFEVIPANGLVEKWVEKGVPYILLENKTVN
ncbi:MAG: FG-GAP-like repeat-containing protein [Flavipsychrobacter sp.]